MSILQAQELRRKEGKTSHFILFPCPILSPGVYCRLTPGCRPRFLRPKALHSCKVRAPDASAAINVHPWDHPGSRRRTRLAKDSPGERWKAARSNYSTSAALHDLPLLLASQRWTTCVHCHALPNVRCSGAGSQQALQLAKPGHVCLNFSSLANASSDSSSGLQRLSGDLRVPNPRLRRFRHECRPPAAEFPRAAQHQSPGRPSICSAGRQARAVLKRMGHVQRGLKKAQKKPSSCSLDV